MRLRILGFRWSLSFRELRDIQGSGAVGFRDLGFGA